MIDLRLAVAAAAAVLMVAGPALADECPLPPSPPPESGRPTPPKMPADPPCYNAATNVSHCNNTIVRQHNAAIDAFNNDISTFNQASNTYVNALNDYVRKVNEYSHCEIELLNRR